MTDRYSSFLVVLERDTRDDDAEGILAALRMLRGVSEVVPNVTSGFESAVGKQRASREWTDALLDVIEAMRRK